MNDAGQAQYGSGGVRRAGRGRARDSTQSRLEARLKAEADGSPASRVTFTDVTGLGALGEGATVCFTLPSPAGEA